MKTMTNNKRRNVRGGFTLLEVLLVLAILGVIAAMVVPNLLGSQKKAMIDATKANIAGLEHMVELYATHHDGEFPPNLSLLLDPVDRNGNAMTPYTDRMPADSWGQPLYYEYPNTRAQRALKPAIWSGGPNKQNEEGAGDDINNWSEVAM
jgi:general secretion pathway protein G